MLMTMAFVNIDESPTLFSKQSIDILLHEGLKYKLRELNGDVIRTHKSQRTPLPSIIIYPF